MSWYRATRTVVIVDVVESVRLMQEFEEETIERWRGFVEEVTATILPRWRGRMVKSLGDGMLLEFQDPLEGARAALEMQDLMRASNPADTIAGTHPTLHLRAGVHATTVVVDEIDIYGSGVNLAARLASLAAPGEVVVSSIVRDAMQAANSFAIEDMGECFLKHFTEPARAFRVRNPGPAGPSIILSPHIEDLQPAVAVIPPMQRQGDTGTLAVGDAIADDLIAALSTNPSLRVLSRLSTGTLRGHHLAGPEVMKLLNTPYLVNGSYAVQGNNLFVTLELSDARNGEVLHAERGRTSINELFAGASQLISDMATAVSRSIVATEVRRVRSMAVPNLPGYSLYVGGVSLLHKLSRSDFDKSRDVLDSVIHRSPRSAAPQAMLAKWHVMKMVQRWSNNPALDAEQARAAARRAQDHDPEHALGIALEGLIVAQTDRDLDAARRLYSRAIDCDPNEAYTWAQLAGLHTYCEEIEQAERAAERAIQLSPLDPSRFIYESYAALAKICAGKHEEAERYARASIARNSTHVPSLFILLIALSMSGRQVAAKDAAKQLHILQPELTAADYLARYPGKDPKRTADWARALKDCAVLTA